MNAVLSTAQEDRLWSKLITSVREGRLVPVSGPGLLEIPDGLGGTKNFYTLVAEELARRLEVDPPKNTSERALNEVACSYLAKLHSLDDNELYGQVKEIVEQLEQSVPIPQALLDLAALPVKLFVTTTFDNLLVRAIEQQHPTWAGRIRQLEYSPVRIGDLDKDKLQDLNDGPPVVFHLFGRATIMSDEYVVSEEDVLEFMRALQSQQTSPEKLFRLMGGNNLLIVGCGFVDWLARFFIRLSAPNRLSAIKGKTNWFIEPAANTPEFTAFLEHYSRSTKHFSLGSVEFIARFAEKLPHDLTLTPSPRALARDILEGGLFLSYASEDRAIVERIQQALSKDIDCWFDRQQLIGGDDWESKIIRNVNACSLFVLILSRHTLTQQDRFFRHEWHEAFKRSIGFAANARFLIPLVIDDIQPNNPALPLELQKPNWERLPAGEVTPAFREFITAAFQQAQLRARGSAT